MHFFRSNPVVTVEDDWDAVVEAYELDAPLPATKPAGGFTPPDNACLRVIR